MALPDHERSAWAAFDDTADAAAADFVHSEAEEEAANDRTLSCAPLSINSLTLDTFLAAFVRRYLEGGGERDEMSEEFPATTIEFCGNCKYSDVPSRDVFCSSERLVAMRR